MEFILFSPHDPNPDGTVGKCKSILKTLVTSGSQYLGTSNIGCSWYPAEWCLLQGGDTPIPGEGTRGGGQLEVTFRDNTKGWLIVLANMPPGRSKLWALWGSESAIASYGRCSVTSPHAANPHSRH